VHESTIDSDDSKVRSTIPTEDSRSKSYFQGCKKLLATERSSFRVATDKMFHIFSVFIVYNGRLTVQEELCRVS
jgi:hypothetical protein